MQKRFKADQVINGTYGELWYNGQYLAQVISCKIEISIKTTAISQIQSLVDGQKMIGLEPKGEFKLHHINSYVMRNLSDDLKMGKTPRCTIISNLKDPDALGGERIVCYNCLLDKMILADWEAGKAGEESYSFTFDDWEVLDAIK